MKRQELNNSLFADLRLTVKEYLSKSQRYFDKEITTHAIVLESHDSCVQLFEKIHKYHLHKVFTVDENKVPLRTISLCDILRAFLN